jgi:hypothetical protein
MTLTVRAVDLRVGDKIGGMNITRVHTFGNQEAVKGKTNMPWPKGKNGRPIKGAFAIARLIRQAIQDCYLWVPTSVLAIVGRRRFFFHPNEQVEITRETELEKLNKAA